MNGYAGKFLEVDLNTRTVAGFSLEEARLKKFIGGSSLAASLYLERYNLQADPLAAESPFMVMSGPLVGSGFKPQPITPEEFIARVLTPAISS